MGNTTNSTSLVDESKVDLSELLTKPEADNMRNLIKYHIQPKSYSNTGFSYGFTSSMSSSNDSDSISLKEFTNIIKGRHDFMNDGLIR